MNSPSPSKIAEALVAAAEAKRIIASMERRIRVSIDQCFLLDMVESAPTAIPLRDALIAAVERERVLCPIHPEESVFESSLFRPELRQKVFDLQRRLAEGFCFHSFGDRVQREVMSYLLKSPLPPIWPRPFMPPDQAVEALRDANRAGRAEYQARLDAVVSSPAARTKSLEEIVEDLTGHHVGSLQQVLAALRDGKGWPASPKIWEYAGVIGERLRRIGVTSGDLVQLDRWVASGGWHQSASLVAFTRLWAAIEVEGLRNNRRTRANDLLDVLRVSVGFADAHVLMCDNAMESFVRQARLPDVLPGRRVYGMRDMAAATAFFQAL